MTGDLVVRDLTVEFRSPRGPVRACRAVSFTLAAGTRLALVGESGSGKTTTALALMGMLPPAARIVSGTATLGGSDLLRLQGEAQREARLAVVSYVPQGAMNSLNPVLAIGRQIVHGLVDHGVTRAKADARASELLAMVGLPPGVARLFPHELSGGMKQRVCIAIAASMRPALLLADEPTSALDVITQRHVMEALAASQRALGNALLLIAHDMALVAQFADRVMVMHKGEVVEDGLVRPLLAAPRHEHTRMLIESVPRLQMEKAAGAAPSRTEAGPPLLEFASVSKTYGERGRGALALSGLSFRLAGSPAGILAVVGQSGSGKTTLASLALGLATPSTGAVLYRGSAIASLGRTAWQGYRREVQAVFQDPYATFNPFYRVDRAIVRPLRRFGLARSRPHAMSMAAEACAEVGLDPDAVLGRFPHELSGGQRQRLMIARALALRPRLLIADEPVSMVDASLRATILRNLARLRQRHEVSVIYITHDLVTAQMVADHLMVLHRGRAVEAGQAHDVISAPRHPYTRELVDAIPSLDPGQAWLREGKPRPAGSFDAPAVFGELSPGFTIGRAA